MGFPDSSVDDLLGKTSYEGGFEAYEEAEMRLLMEAHQQQEAANQQPVMASTNVTTTTTSSSSPGPPRGVSSEITGRDVVGTEATQQPAPTASSSGAPPPSDHTHQPHHHRSHAGHGHVRTTSFASRDDFIHFLSCIVWTCSVRNSYLLNELFAYHGHPLSRPIQLRSEPPLAHRAAVPESLVRRALPSVADSSLLIGTFYLLSRAVALHPDNFVTFANPLMSSTLREKKLLSSFLEDMVLAEKNVASRNVVRAVPFLGCSPSRIAVGLGLFLPGVPSRMDEDEADLAREEEMEKAAEAAAAAQLESLASALTHAPSTRVSQAAQSTKEGVAEFARAATITSRVADGRPPPLAEIISESARAGEGWTSAPLPSVSRRPAPPPTEGEVVTRPQRRKNAKFKGAAALVAMSGMTGKGKGVLGMATGNNYTPTEMHGGVLPQVGVGRPPPPPPPPPPPGVLPPSRPSVRVKGGGEITGVDAPEIQPAS